MSAPSQSFPVISRALVLATLAYASQHPPRPRPRWLAAVVLVTAVLLTLMLRAL